MESNKDPVAKLDALLAKHGYLSKDHHPPSATSIKALLLCPDLKLTGQAFSMYQCILQSIVPNMVNLQALGNQAMRASADQLWKHWGVVTDAGIYHLQGIAHTFERRIVLARMLAAAKMFAQALEMILKTRMPFGTAETPAYIRESAALQARDIAKNEMTAAMDKKLSSYDKVFNPFYGLHRAAVLMLMVFEDSSPFPSKFLGTLIMTNGLPQMLSTHENVTVNTLVRVRDCWAAWGLGVEDFTWTRLLRVEKDAGLSTSCSSKWKFKALTEESNIELYRLIESTKKLSEYLGKISQSKMSLPDRTAMLDGFRYNVLIWKYRRVFERDVSTNQSDVGEFLMVANGISCFAFEERIFNQVLPLMARLQEHQDPEIHKRADFIWSLWAANMRKAVVRYSSNEVDDSSEDTIVGNIMLGLTEVFGELLEECVERDMSFEESLKKCFVGAEKVGENFNPQGEARPTLDELLSKNFHSMRSRQPAITYEMRQRNFIHDHSGHLDGAQALGKNREDQKKTGVHRMGGDLMDILQPYNDVLQPYSDLFSGSEQDSELSNIIAAFMRAARDDKDCEIEDVISSHLLPAAQQLKNHDNSVVRMLFETAWTPWYRTGAALILMSMKAPRLGHSLPAAMKVEEAMANMLQDFCLLTRRLSGSFSEDSGSRYDS
ncbi:hypothetical protein PMIN06_004827 [Paraphaeosphaeria minitans]